MASEKPSDSILFGYRKSKLLTHKVVCQQQALYLACPFEDTRRTSPSSIYFCPGGNDDFGRTSPKSHSQTSKPSPNGDKTHSRHLLLCQEPSGHVSS